MMILMRVLPVGVVIIACMLMSGCLTTDEYYSTGSYTTIPAYTYTYNPYRFYNYNPYNPRLINYYRSGYYSGGYWPYYNGIYIQRQFYSNW